MWWSVIFPRTGLLTWQLGKLEVTLNTYTHLRLEDAEDELKRVKGLEDARKELDKAKGEKTVSQKLFRAI